ncbi:hypothetical protein IV203_001597 [Nitzschia inconspicua]|uniref:Uncharacterized protein n=1 Tax=Nitzschia inconspicua TaxID=303405 RepID=A0A9K3L8J3_9STRA|nr:hypothetical protein IV203_001597 [Nitzschia inconspicua]
MNAGLVLSKVPPQAAACAAASLMSFCVVCNTAESSKAFATAATTSVAFLARSASTFSAPSTFAVNHSASCHCMTCVSRGIHTISCNCADCSGAHGVACACGTCSQLKMASHKEGCSCGTCSVHGANCSCGSCSAHGPGCICSTCRM